MEYQGHQFKPKWALKRGRKPKSQLSVVDNSQKVNNLKIELVDDWKEFFAEGSFKYPKNPVNNSDSIENLRNCDQIELKNNSRSFNVENYDCMKKNSNMTDEKDVIMEDQSTAEKDNFHSDFAISQSSNMKIVSKLTQKDLIDIFCQQIIETTNRIQLEKQNKDLKSNSQFQTFSGYSPNSSLILSQKIDDLFKIPFSPIKITNIHHPKCWYKKIFIISNVRKNEPINLFHKNSAFKRI